MLRKETTPGVASELKRAGSRSLVFAKAKTRLFCVTRKKKNKFFFFARFLEKANLRFLSYSKRVHSKLKAAKVVFSRAEVRLMDERGTKNAALAAFNLNGGAGSRTRTYEARRREIYSLLSLPLDDSSATIIISNKIQKSTSNPLFQKQNSFFGNDLA